MKSHAQVVIIGGGIFGASVAYHLAKAGCTDIVLVDKGELTSGTTFHSVGLVSQFRTSPALMKVMNTTIALFNRLKEEVGDTLDWHTVGSLRLASKAMSPSAGYPKTDSGLSPAPPFSPTTWAGSSYTCPMTVR